MIDFYLLLVANHAVYKTSNILHRDISPNAIMFYYRASQDDNTVLQAVGVLCDWDLVLEPASPSIEDITTDLLTSTKSMVMQKILSFKDLEAVQPTVHQSSTALPVSEAPTWTRSYWSHVIGQVQDPLLPSTSCCTIVFLTTSIGTASSPSSGCWCGLLCALILSRIKSNTQTLG